MEAYILDGRTPVPVSMATWSAWYKTADCHVGRTVIGPALVSTVFLGIDHAFGEGPPLLFESMAFNLPDGEDWQERCSTWEQAEAMHADMCERVRTLLGQG